MDGMRELRSTQHKHASSQSATLRQRRVRCATLTADCGPFRFSGTVTSESQFTHRVDDRDAERPIVLDRNQVHLRWNRDKPKTVLTELIGYWVGLLCRFSRLVRKLVRLFSNDC